jgi:hypothetical protein
MLKFNHFKKYGYFPKHLSPADESNEELKIKNEKKFKAFSSQLSAFFHFTPHSSRFTL